MVDKVRVTITGTYDLLPEFYPGCKTPEEMMARDEANPNLDEVSLLESTKDVTTTFTLLDDVEPVNKPCACKEVQTGYQGDPDFHIKFCTLHQNASDLLELAKQTLDVIRLIDEGKPVPLGYFKAKVSAAIDRAEGK